VTKGYIQSKNNTYLDKDLIMVARQYRMARLLVNLQYAATLLAGTRPCHIRPILISSKSA
jgi:hypothetical protein